MPFKDNLRLLKTTEPTYGARSRKSFSRILRRPPARSQPGCQGMMCRESGVPPGCSRSQPAISFEMHYLLLTRKRGSVIQSCSLLNSTLQSTEGVLSSFRSNWQEFVEDLDFWRVLLLMLLLLVVVITLLSLGLAYYVSRVLPFSGWRGGRKINEDLYVEQKLWYLFVVQI
uniref:Uncharacterized protein n=1 Tax=Astatotilapia calliptera TaxID=8154 RepID=A0AAX7V296_ASTCA